MSNVAKVTCGNAPHKLKCAATGLYLSDATVHFDTIAVTYKPALALDFPDFEGATIAQKLVKSLYGSFDWQPVAVSA